MLNSDYSQLARQSWGCEEIWWFFHLIASMIRVGPHRRRSQIASDGEKNSYKKRGWIEKISHESTRD